MGGHETMHAMKSAFETWWYEEGSGMRPETSEDHEEHTKRIARIAWENGAFTATKPISTNNKQK